MVFDKAHGALARALQLDPRDARTYDALARLWRDAGLPHLALGDAYRAVHFSAWRAGTRNTLGTVLQALGRSREALTEFTRRRRQARCGLRLEQPLLRMAARRAAGRGDRACQHALRLQPTLQPRRTTWAWRVPTPAT